MFKFNDEGQLKCSFAAKPRQVRKLVAGPVYTSVMSASIM